MTEVRFLFTGELLTGFHMKGHSTASAEDEVGRLVCSAVSSAVYMAMNTVIEVIGATVDLAEEPETADMCFQVLSDLEEAMPILCGLKLHLEQLSGQYPEHITIISEV